MRTIVSIARKLSSLSFLTLFCAVTALPAQAHESRILDDNYAIAFGWLIEPPVENGPNSLFFAADVVDPPGSETFPLLDRDEGDTVKLTAIPFRLDTDNVNSENIVEVLAHIVELFPPLSHFSRCDSTDGSGCEDIGYVKAFTPPHAGPYGAFLVGKLKRHNHDGFVFPKIFFAETFVCGLGSQDPESEFECVEEEE